MNGPAQEWPAPPVQTLSPWSSLVGMFCGQRHWSGHGGVGCLRKHVCAKWDQGESHDVNVLPKHRGERSSLWLGGGRLHRIGNISAEFWRVCRNLPDEKKKNTVSPDGGLPVMKHVACVRNWELARSVRLETWSGARPRRCIYWDKEKRLSSFSTGASSSPNRVSDKC